MIGHSLVELLAPLAEKHPHPGLVARRRRSPRPALYPDALPERSTRRRPADVFSSEQAMETIAQAAEFIDRAPI